MKTHAKKKTVEQNNKVALVLKTTEAKGNFVEYIHSSQTIYKTKGAKL